MSTYCYPLYVNLTFKVQYTLHNCHLGSHETGIYDLFELVKSNLRKTKKILTCMPNILDPNVGAGSKK